MATLSTDTPTLHNLSSNSHSYPVDDYIEQGVLPSENRTDDIDNNIKNECNEHPNDNHLLVPMEYNFNVKTEPSIDIDDSHGIDDDNSNSNQLSSSKIRLKPTSKLMATSAPGTNTFKVTKKYACPYENCTKSYGKSSHLRSHLTWHTGIKPYVCQVPGCGKGFTRSDELNRHTRTHTGEKPFECVQCTKKFSRSDHLSKHLATHAKHQNNQVNKSKWQGGKSDVKPVLPIIMPAKSVESGHFLAALTDHSIDGPPEDLTDEAPIAAQPIKIKVEKPDYSDNEMEYGSYKEDLNVQSRMFDDDKTPKVSVRQSPVSPSILVPEVKMEPSIHYNDVDNDDNHDHDIEPDDDAIMPEANLPPFSEDVKVTTAAAAAAAASAAITNGVSNLAYDPLRPYKCMTCTKLFKRQDDLSRHMRCHTGEKPFICNECDKTFKRTGNLKKHLNVHAKIR